MPSAADQTMTMDHAPYEDESTVATCSEQHACVGGWGEVAGFFGTRTRGLYSVVPLEDSAMSHMRQVTDA